MKIIGCGNPDRGDDAAGLLVVQELRAARVNAVEHTGVGVDLLDMWSADDDVILVDATCSGAPPGTITVWDAHAGPLPVLTVKLSSHSLGVGGVVELARALGRLPRCCVIYGIEAGTADFGTPVSPAVLASVRQIVRAVAERSSPAPTNGGYGIRR